MTEHKMHQALQAEIKDLELEYGIEVLLAVEYGSRAWGLEHAGSDYDIRLIYRDPVHQAFSLFQDRETISRPTMVEGVEVDLTCWSLPKALKLATVSNPQLNEFLACPVKYRSDDIFIDDLTRICNAASPRVMAHYYRGSAKKNLLQKICDCPQVDVKATLQMLRGTLSAQWIVQNPGQGNFPPIDFETLLDAVDHSKDRLYFDETRAQIDRFVALKREGGHCRDPHDICLIEQFGLEAMERLPEQIGYLNNPYVDQSLAESAFQKQYPQTFSIDEITCPEVCL